MIPRIIHQIWIGPKEKPEQWMRTWRDNHPTWKYFFWDEKNIADLGLKNQKIYDEYYKQDCFNGASNIARAEILKKYGGIYIDADSICLHNLDNAPFIAWDFFSVYEADDLYVEGMKLVANGIIGAIPNHPIINTYIKEQGKITDLRSSRSWIQSGPLLWTKVCGNKGILPPYTFLPEHHSGKKNKIEGIVYARQFWGTTHKLYKD